MSCNEKFYRKNIDSVTTFSKRDMGCDRIGFSALRLSVVMLGIAWSFQSAVARERFEHAFGDFETQSAKQGIIIAAPHGTYDIHTDVLAKDVARVLGAGYIVARGFSSGASRVNVNRPTEGAGRTCEHERRTERARGVYDHYVRLVGKSCNGKTLRLYVEIHGHTSLAFLNRLEIATTGITMEEARQLKEQFPAFLSQAKALYPAYPELALRVEPIDKVFFGAGCNKKIGYISTGQMDRALHMEIPRSARTPKTLEATAALVSAIVRATMNLDEPDFGSRKKKNPEADEKSAGSRTR
ncbi:MAG: hypothetical protein APR55_01960 [Methanolinea sp. SDB]|nr:MAG: hypothetical protein APR55_01960 [Methanolinea sp. SDB]